MASMIDDKLIAALSNASTLELFELSTVIDRLLADPRRIVAVRNKLNLGRAVRFMDWRTGQMRAGKIVAIKDSQVTVHEDGTNTQWKLSYAAIDPGEQAQPLESDSLQHSQTHPAKMKKEDFRRGDRVSFTDKYLQPQVGTVTRVNQRTASVECDGGSSWRVPFSMLNRVLDI